MKSIKTEVKKEEKSCHKFAVKKKTKTTTKGRKKKFDDWRIFCASKGTQNNATFFLNDTLIIFTNSYFYAPYSIIIMTAAALEY